MRSLFMGSYDYYKVMISSSDKRMMNANFETIFITFNSFVVTANFSFFSKLIFTGCSEVSSIQTTNCSFPLVSRTSPCLIFLSTPISTLSTFTFALLSQPANTKDGFTSGEFFEASNIMKICRISQLFDKPFDPCHILKIPPFNSIILGATFQDLAMGINDLASFLVNPYSNVFPLRLLTAPNAE